MAQDIYEADYYTTSDETVPLDMSAHDKPKVLVKTAVGDFSVELYPSKAPVTVENFLRYVDEGLYDGTTFARTVTMENQPNNDVKIEVVQGGMVAKEKSYPPIEHETTDVIGLKHLEGTISMARGKPGSATASFFLCLRDEPELDYGGQRNKDGQGFSAFGMVTEGMDVVREIHKQPYEGQRLVHPVEIISIRRV